MDALIVIVALLLVISWLARRLQKAGAWLCEFGQSLTDLSVAYKSAALHQKARAASTTKGGQDEDGYMVEVRREIRALTDPQA